MHATSVFIHVATFIFAFFQFAHGVFQRYSQLPVSVRKETRCGNIIYNETLRGSQRSEHISKPHGAIEFLKERLAKGSVYFEDAALFESTPVIFCYRPAGNGKRVTSGKS